MLFFAGDDRGISLWREAAAWNAGDVESQLAAFDDTVELQTEPGKTLNGPAELRSWLEQKLKEGRGLVRAELASLKQIPVLLFWQYAKTGEKTRHSLLRISKYRQGRIAKAYMETRPAPLNEAQPSGLINQYAAARPGCFGNLRPGWT